MLEQKVSSKIVLIVLFPAELVMRGYERKFCYQSIRSFTTLAAAYTKLWREEKGADLLFCLNAWYMRMISTLA